MPFPLPGPSFPCRPHGSLLHLEVFARRLLSLTLLPEIATPPPIFLVPLFYWVSSPHKHTGFLTDFLPSLQETKITEESGVNQALDESSPSDLINKRETPLVFGSLLPRSVPPSPPRYCYLLYIEASYITLVAAKKPASESLQVLSTDQQNQPPLGAC